MSDPHDDDRRLSELFHDAVSDVEPHEALDSIRNRTKVTPMSSRNRSGSPWRYALLGAAATAAVIGAIAYAGGNLDLTGSEDDTNPAGAPATHQASGGNHEASQTPSPAPSDEPAATTMTVAAYYIGTTPQGPRLYREFDQVDAASKLDAALAVLTRSPSDPDYETPWPDGAFAAVSYPDGADTITVSLADGSLHDRPSGMSEQYAEEAIQQVVYTLQAAAQDRLPVQFVLDGNPVDQVLGVPTSEPVSNASVLDTLSHVSLSTPSEGQVVSGGTLRVDGVANSFEANVVVRVQRYEGTEIVAQEPFTAEGWMDDKLFPFSGTIDLTGVPAGKYLVMAMTDDPSGGAEGNGAFTDTRLITIG